MDTPTFTCALCRGTFAQARSDDDAVAELAETFPGATKESCDVVCESCYQSMGIRPGGQVPCDACHATGMHLPMEAVLSVLLGLTDRYQVGPCPACSGAGYLPTIHGA